MAAMLATLALSVEQAVAATFIWDGGGNDNNWSTRNNWNPNGRPPTASGINDFTFTASGVRPDPNLEASYTIQTLTFGAGGGAFSFTGGGGSQILTINGLSGTGITNNSGSAQSFANSIESIVLGSAQTWNAGTASGGSLTVNSAVNLGAYTLTIDGSNNTSLAGITSGTGATGITKTGAGTLTLSGTAANTYTGLTTVNAGTLTLNKTAGINAIAGDLTIGDGAGTGTVTLAASNQIANTSVVTLADGILNTGTGLVDTVGVFNMSSGSMNGTGTITATTYGLSGGTVAANLGTGTMNVTSGTVTLSGTAAATAVNISSGTLSLGSSNRLADASAVTVNGGTLAIGSNSDTVGAVTLTSGGITGTGTLTSTSGFTMNSAGATGTSAILAGAVNLTKSGAGTLTLSGTNTYSGVTTLGGGIVSVATIGDGGVAGNLGQASNSAANIVFNGGTLQYTGASATTNRAFTITAATTGTIDITSSNLTISGAGASTAGALTKTGAGTLTLTGANAYSGATTVNAGTLTLAGASGAITSSSGVTIGEGGTLKLDNTSGANQTNRLNNTGTVTMAGGTLNFSNNGGAANYSETTGALTMSSGINTIATSQAAMGQSSTLTFASLTRSAGASIDFTGTGLGVDARNMILFTTGPTLVNGILGAWATCNGAGYATYDATLGVKEYTAYADVTRLSSGTKSIANAAANNVRIIEGTGAAANITLAATVTTINSLYQSSSGGSGAATVDTASKTLRLGASGGILSQSGAGTLTLGTTANSGTLTAGGADNTAGNITITNASTNGITITSLIANNGSGVVALTKQGAGSLTLTGTNTYTGVTTISGGTLSVATIGAGAVAGNLGAAAATAGNLVIGNGTLQYTGATASTNRAVTIATNQVATLDISTNNLTLTGVVSGAGGSLTKEGDGTLTLAGTVANTFTGVTTVNAGTLVLSGTGPTNTTLLGNLIIGDGIGTDTVTITVSGQVANAAGVTVNSSGVLNFSGTNILEEVAFLKMNAGTVSTGATGTATVFLGGDVTSYANAASATISGQLDLNLYTPAANVTRTFNIANGAAAVDMVVSAVISDKGTTYSGSLTKAGDGTLALSGVNTYTGVTTAAGGKLTISSTGNINSGNAVTIAGGEFNYNSTTALSKAVTFSGTGGTLSGSGTITPAVTVTSGNTYAPGEVGDPGTQTLTGGATFNGGSIFAWDLDVGKSDPGANSMNAGTYDKVVTSGAVTGTASVFNILLGTNAFTDEFWKTSKQWNNIFTIGGGGSTLQSIFTTFGGSVPTNGQVRGQGEYEGNFFFISNTLYWGATGAAGGYDVVPETSSVVAGLLLASGLVRRRR